MIDTDMLIAQRRKLLPGNSLRARLLLFMALGALMSLFILGSLGYMAVRQTLDRSLEQREVLARVTAAHLEGVLEVNLRYLADFGGPAMDIEDTSDIPGREALRNLYFQSLFDDRVFLLDPQGVLLLSEPQELAPGQEDFSALPYFREARDNKRLTVSSVHYRQPGDRPVVSAVAPLRTRAGRLVGWVGGSIDLTGLGLARIIAPARLGETGHVEVVDSTGVVLASTRPDLLLAESDHGQILAGLIATRESAVRTCHSCHLNGGTSQRETDVMAFVPLTTIPWGVSIRQSEAEALAPVRSLQQRFILFGGLLLLLNIVLAYGISRGVVNPVRTLTSSARRLAQGELNDPIPPLGNDEVGVLGASLESMRQRLQASLETIQEWNKVLEARVAERAHRLEEAQVDREHLLQRLISAQEEERKRVARELHDEVSQNILTLALALDQLANGSKQGADTLSGPFAEMKALALRTHDSVRRLILALRPSVLDDLGLVAAMQWWAENRLERQGVKVHWDLPELVVTMSGAHPISSTEPTCLEPLLFSEVAYPYSGT
ncbi:MAG: cache domain-containing protein [Dehalococcoidia bacterium]|nr:cache domain-containing protein [Dehalococcoidia bacterium]